MLNLLIALKLATYLTTLYAAYRLFHVAKELQEYLLLENVLKTINFAVPVGARVIYDQDTYKRCATCKAGSIVRRRRFLKVTEGPDGIGLKEVTTIYHCDKCNLKTVALKK